MPSLYPMNLNSIPTIILLSTLTAMGKIQRLPRFINDSSNEVEAVQIMPISWGGDHRAIDGATMARFSNAWKYYVENPQAMMFEMR
jgi:2-oxoisovalerate dehydrogenase E2 component (dihydrolipoyl transacylase)